MADTIDDMIDALDRMAGSRLGPEAAKRAVKHVDRAVKATAATGKTPDGQSWAAKKDGGRALVHAADALSTTSRGSIVTVTLKSPEVFHNFSKSHKRQILPDAGAAMPANIEEALRAAADEAFDEATK